MENMPMSEKSFQVYGYRWVVLAGFMLINLTIQIMWICFAPITGPAARFYGVSDLKIGFLAMSFMIVYIPLSIPASWAIDTFGYRKAVGFGAILMGIFGISRGLLAANYTWVLLTTLGIAVAQPFLLNAVTTVAAKWFPIQERATASGLAMVAGFIGIAIGQVFSPLLILKTGIPAMLLITGVISALSAVVFLVLSREAPPSPPCLPGEETRALVLDGLKSMLKMTDIWLLLILFLVGMGIFNGVSTWIENIVRSRGFSITQAGDFGAFLLIGGVVGAIVIPLLSDRLRRRKIFLISGMMLGVPGLIGFTFATHFGVLAASMALLGFAMMGLAPIGYQYAAEISFPAPEGTSNGLLNLAGQASVVFIYAMDAFKGTDGSFTSSLIFLIVMMFLSSLLLFWLNESKLVSSNKDPDLRQT
jgi:MFS family permease